MSTLAQIVLGILTVLVLTALTGYFVAQEFRLPDRGPVPAHGAGLGG
jgi:hypothetical protein